MVEGISFLLGWSVGYYLVKSPSRASRVGSVHFGWALGRPRIPFRPGMVFGPWQSAFSVGAGDRGSEFLGGEPERA